MATQDAVQVSFEFFPPNTEAMEKTLWDSVQRLKNLARVIGRAQDVAEGRQREERHAPHRGHEGEHGVAQPADGGEQRAHGR